MTEELDSDGYRTVRTWGEWALKEHPENGAVYLENVRRGYPIEIGRILGEHDLDWAEHISRKAWPKQEVSDFLVALAEIEAAAAKAAQ